MKKNSQKAETCVTLKNGLLCFTDRIHSVTQDSGVLADFCEICERDIACDLGTGCGIIPLLWRDSGFCGPITAVELMPGAVALARQNFAQPGLLSPVTLLHADLRTLTTTPENSFSLITMNPPYYPTGCGRSSPSVERNAAFTELFCTPAELCRAGDRLLSVGGRLCCCFPPSRLEDYRAAAQAEGLTVSHLEEVRSGSQSPYLILMRAIKEKKQ